MMIPWHLQRAAEHLADTVHADVSAQVRLAWALERDRLYAELAEARRVMAAHGQRLYQLELLAAELAELRDEVCVLTANVARWHHAHMTELHSVKVPAHATTPVERGRYTGETRT